MKLKTCHRCFYKILSLKWYRGFIKVAVTFRAKLIGSYTTGNENVTINIIKQKMLVGIWIKKCKIERNFNTNLK